MAYIKGLLGAPVQQRAKQAPPPCSACRAWSRSWSTTTTIPAAAGSSLPLLFLLLEEHASERDGSDGAAVAPGGRARRGAGEQPAAAVERAPVQPPPGPAAGHNGVAALRRDHRVPQAGAQLHEAEEAQVPTPSAFRSPSSRAPPLHFTLVCLPKSRALEQRSASVRALLCLPSPCQLQYVHVCHRINHSLERKYSSTRKKK